MSDPKERESDLNPQPLPPGEPRKGVSPLIWILLLLALLALGWWFYNRSAQSGLDTTPATTTTEPAITSEQEVAAQAERERTAANERRRQERAQAKREARSKGPADREVSPVARVQPDYPPAAYRAGEEGTVLLRVDVDANGNPTNVDISRRSGSRELDRAAQRAVREWKFKPAIKGGKQVASVVEIPVDFKLERQ